MSDTLAIAFRLARRELRSGLQGFRIFLACLILGVGAIAIVGSLSAALERGIANEGRTLMGGDIEFSVLHNEPTPNQREFINEAGRVSRVATLRAMAAAPSFNFDSRATSDDCRCSSAFFFSPISRRR